jgi:hypothetical protein
VCHVERHSPFAFRRPRIANREQRTASLEIKDPVGSVRAWVPLPLSQTTPYQRDRGHQASGNAAKTTVSREAASAPMVIASWPQSDTPPTLTVTMRVEASDYRVALDAPGPTRSKPRDPASRGRRHAPRRLDPEHFKYEIAARAL